ncbi:futalosine synthase [Desulfotomaculum arcticum]|uniref:Chorismate dehydratase n=1 Tax=Desulfotruncus arcticus DSM 17038 TaxID=1121424 RepID=A0A1I2NAP2_9FIRM|nr:menaquinone biosynthesis protein [Desulfotruncus arcticus]SFG00643.1 futalosine synthase [Desulfotomaculum arcticum] [Desulfotruncus arcticus DSM 17038]
MTRLRVGQVEYLNCIPVYHALEDGLLDADIELIKGPPTKLNNMFLNGELDITPISSIEYAKYKDKCIIIPNMSISADGNVESILLFSHCPPTELEGKTVNVTTSSATSVVLLRILFEHYYHVQVEFHRSEPNLDAMLASADAALLIGDDAMLAHQAVMQNKPDINVTDLGKEWKNFTGEKMVYAVWVVHAELAENNPEIVEQISRLFNQAKAIGLANRDDLVNKGHKRSHLPHSLLNHYFDTIHHDLGESERRALLTYYDYAYKSGIIEERIKLTIWGE